VEQWVITIPPFWLDSQGRKEFKFVCNRENIFVMKFFKDDFSLFLNVAAYVGYLEYPKYKTLPSLAQTQCNWGDGMPLITTGIQFILHLMDLHM
jgi:hypothetical protein